MTVLTAAQKTAQRDEHPHVKHTYLTSVPYIPIFQAQVNDASIGVGETSIVYNNGVLSAALFALVDEDMLFVVGSTAGDDDLGRGWVRSISGNEVSGTLEAAWNSFIDWADDVWVTAYFVYMPRPKFPFFTVSPEDHFKDKDTDYVAQNTNRPGVPIVGPGWSGWLSDAVDINLDATQSQVMTVGGSITTYAWSVTTADLTALPSIASPSSAATTITLDKASLHWVKLIITMDNGSTETTVRPFLPVSTTYDNPLEQGERTLSKESGIVAFRFTLNEQADESSIPKGTRIIVWSDNWYQGVKKTILNLTNPQYVDREHIEFDGYVTNTGATISLQGRGSVEFEAASIDGVFGQRFEYPTSLIAEPSVTGGFVNEWWKFKYDELTVANGLHYLWKYHSNWIKLSDIHLPTGDTKIRAGLEEFTQGSLLDRAAAFCRDNSIFAQITTNQFGATFVEIDPQMEDVSDRAAIPVILALTSEDWQGDLGFKLKDTRTVAYGYSNGGYWDGETFVPYLSKWGPIAGNEGTAVLNYENLMVASQADLNLYLGRLVALANNPITELTMAMAGNWASALSIAPRAWVELTLTGSEPGNKRGIKLTAARLQILNIQTSYNQPYGIARTSIVMEPEALGRDAVDGDYPGFESCPPGGGSRSQSSKQETLSDQKAQDITLPPLTVVLFHSGNVYFRRWTDSDWTTIITEAGMERGSIYNFYHIDAGSYDSALVKLFTGKVGEVKRLNGVKYIENGRYSPSSLLEPPYYDITPSVDPPNDWSDAPAPTVAVVTFAQVISDAFTEFVRYDLVTWQNGASQWRSWIGKTAGLAATTYVSVYDQITPPTHSQAISLACGVSHLYVTAWNGTILELLIFDKSTLAYVSKHNLGTASASDISDRINWGFPIATMDVSGSAPDNIAPVYVGGRFVNPSVMSAGTYWILKYNGSWSEVEVKDELGEDEDWTTDHCSALAVGTYNGGNGRVIKAFRQGVS